MLTDIRRAFCPAPASARFPTAPWWIDRGRSALIVLPAAFVLGMLTSLGQLALPDWLSSLANSSGGWSIVAFGLVWTSRSRPVFAVILAVAAFFLLNVGYAVMSDIRGFHWSLALDNFFVLVGFVAGPPVGLAAAWMRARSDSLVAVATSALPAVLVGDGLHGLIRISDTTSPVYWTLSILAGVAFIAVIGWVRLLSVGPIVLSCLLTLAGAGMLFQLYDLA